MVEENKYWIYIIIGLAIILLMVFALLFFLGSHKQEKVYHVGILSRQNTLSNNLTDGFTKEMVKLGYVEGENIVYDIQKTNLEPENETKILKKFVEDKVDLIYTFNNEEALWAKNITLGTGIPVVFANAFTEGNNLVESVRAPGGNITGVRYPGTDIAVKRLEVLHQIVPNARRIWVPYQYGLASASSQFEVLRPAAASYNLTIIEFPSKNITSLQIELENRLKSGEIGFDAVLFIPDPLSTTPANFILIANYTRGRKIPIGGSSIVTQDYGTLFAVTVNSNEMGTQAAHLADKILKGTPAGTLPVVTPETYLIINNKVAQELNLTIPESLFSFASEIVK